MPNSSFQSGGSSLLVLIPRGDWEYMRLPYWLWPLARGFSRSARLTFDLHSGRRITDFARLGRELRRRGVAVAPCVPGDWGKALSCLYRQGETSVLIFGPGSGEEHTMALRVADPEGKLNTSDIYTLDNLVKIEDWPSFAKDLRPGLHVVCAMPLMNRLMADANDDETFFVKTLEKYRSGVFRRAGALAFAAEMLGESRPVLVAPVLPIAPVPELRHLVVRNRHAGAFQKPGGRLSPELRQAQLEYAVGQVVPALQRNGFATAYAFDTAVTTAGAPLLVEVNNPFAMGLYRDGPGILAEALASPRPAVASGWWA